MTTPSAKVPSPNESDVRSASERVKPIVPEFITHYTKPQGLEVADQKAHKPLYKLLNKMMRPKKFPKLKLSTKPKHKVRFY